MKNDYVTHKQLEQAFHDFEQRFEAKIDAKFEAWSEEIINRIAERVVDPIINEVMTQVSEIIQDFADHVDARFNAIEKEQREFRRKLLEHDAQTAVIESKLEQVSVVLSG
jgi:hypothetical protein